MRTEAQLPRATSADPLVPLTLDTLTDVTYARIHRAILDRTLAPGERVTEAGIAKLLQVSKTPVREALLRLREIGLIEADGPRRNRVVSAGSEAFEHAFEMVELLEGFTAEKAASVADEATVQRISAMAERSLGLAREGEIEEFRAVDAEFHSAVGAAAANPRIRKAEADAFSMILALRVRDLLRVESLIDCGLQHVSIAKAIARGDVEDAGREARAHVRYVHAMLGTASPDGSNSST